MALILCAAAAASAGTENTAPPAVVIDTDLRSDVDDAGTLALVNGLADRGECELLGVVASQTGPHIVSAIDAINTFHGRGDVPVGLSPVDDQRFPDHYAPVIGDPARFPSAQSNATAPDSTTLYRRLLHEAEDDSVLIAVIGGQTCVRLLLESEADAEGDGSIGVSGRDLVRDKVRLLAIMGGNFANAEAEEHNINLDREAADVVAAQWPTPVLFCGFEIGMELFTGGAMRDPQTNPVAKAYELYPGAGGVGTIAPSPSFDQATVLSAVQFLRGTHEDLWQVSEPGTVTFVEGRTQFTPSPEGNHRYVTRKAPVEEVERAIEELMVGGSGS